MWIQNQLQSWRTKEPSPRSLSSASLNSRGDFCAANMLESSASIGATSRAMSASIRETTIRPVLSYRAPSSSSDSREMSRTARNSDSTTPWGAVTREVSPSTRDSNQDVISDSSGDIWETTWKWRSKENRIQMENKKEVWKTS